MVNSLKLFSKMFLIILVIVSIGFYLIALILEPFLFYFTPEGLNTSLLPLKALPIWFLNVKTYIPIEIEFGTIFLGLWIIFLLCFIIAFKIPKNFFKIIKEGVTKPTRKLFKSSLFALPLINSMTLLVVFLMHSIQEAGGIPTGTPPTDSNPFIEFVTLSYAVISEELGFRIIPIGIFLFLYYLTTKNKIIDFSLIQKVKLFFISILIPDKAKKVVGKNPVSEVGIGKGISLAEWGILIFTSILFGLTHYNPGVTWEIGKVTSAGFTGLVLGLSYLIYGFHASIIIHWFFNSYTDTFQLISEIYPKTIPFTNSVIILNLILGILGWLVVLILVYKWFIGKSQKRTLMEN